MEDRQDVKAGRREILFEAARERENPKSHARVVTKSLRKDRLVSRGVRA